MLVRWTSSAADDLETIVLHIRKDNPIAAQKVARRIFTEIESLQIMSFRGRPGLSAGTRELVFTPYPYIAVYEVIGDEVRILRVRHAAQDWP